MECARHENIYINEYFSGETASHFSGAKKNGIGEKREGILASDTRVKNVVIDIG